MNATITLGRQGRLVLPKPVRDEQRLQYGDSLEIEVREEGILLRPLRRAAGMRKKMGIWVFSTGQPVSAELVNETIEQVRREREDSFLHPEGAKRPQKRKA